jgi:Flp pilus assembly protein TadG
MPRQSVLSGLGESSGAVLLEFAFVLPFLLLLITGIFDFGFAFREYLLVTNAAREGARMAVLPGYSDQDVRDRVSDYLTKAGGVPAAMIVDATIATGPPDSPPGATYLVKTVTAQVNHVFSLIAPFSTSYGTVSLKAVSVMRVEIPAGAP